MRTALVALVAALAATASDAAPIDACSLLSATDLTELGAAADAARSLEIQQGGVQYCKYQAPSTATGATVTVILSTAVPDRALQFQAMLNKARSESTPEQLRARGEYFAGNATCKVASMSREETSQCLGTTQQSVVGLTLRRRINPESVVSYPTLQLQFISKLVSSVSERGG